MKRIVFAAVVCAVCVEWTRLSGVIKTINLKTETITIQNKDGDLLTVPIDYQVKIADKSGELLNFRRLTLDQKVILTRTPQDKPAEDTSGMALPEHPEPSQHGL